MDLESFTIAMYCWIDAVLAEMHADPDWCRIRQRGPAPTLADSEVLTMEVVGEFLGLDRDTALFAYFRCEHPDWFPALRRVPSSPQDISAPFAAGLVPAAHFFSACRR